MKSEKIYLTTAVLLTIIASVVILIYAKPLLVPLTIAALFAMVLLPVVKMLESRKVPPSLASLVAVLIFMAFLLSIFFFVKWQVSELMSDSEKLWQQVNLKYQQFVTYISEKFGISPAKQKEIVEQQKNGSNMAPAVGSILTGLGTFLTNFILMIVYLFMLIYFRRRIRKFIVMLVPTEERANAEQTISEAQKVAMRYLTGLFAMIVCLWIMYSLGFWIVGVRNPVFFAILCGLLEIVPFIGNLTGTILTISISLIQGAGTNVVIGIIVTYGLIQFIQTYILQPLVVGNEVSINPLFTVIGLVAGEMMWGIPGMIVSIPVLGIARIICDHVTALRPYAFLIGADKSKNGGLMEKIKSGMAKLRKK